MPTARQLLEQADALMRRNRKRGKGKHGGPPTLTDALGIDRGGALAPTIILPEAAAREADPIALDTLSDLPVLTDIVEPAPTPSLPWEASAVEAQAPTTGLAPDNALDDLVADSSDNALDDSLDQALADSPDKALEDALEADALGQAGESSKEPIRVDANAVEVASVEEAAPVESLPDDRPAPAAGPEAISVADGDDSAAVAAPTPRPPIDEEFILEIPPATESQPPADAPTEASPGVVSAPPPVFVPGSPDWDALAEEIRMQVLQRLDLFTDTGMRDQLGARLQPIVARASAELVETINHALGELVRGYVAEAIEREIETWRNRGG